MIGDNKTEYYYNNYYHKTERLLLLNFSFNTFTELLGNSTMVTLIMLIVCSCYNAITGNVCCCHAVQSIYWVVTVLRLRVCITPPHGEPFLYHTLYTFLPFTPLIYI